MLLADFGGRSYTTRSSEVERRSAAPAWEKNRTVHRWEKKWITQEGLQVLDWVKTIEKAKPVPGTPLRRNDDAQREGESKIETSPKAKPEIEASNEDKPQSEANAKIEASPETNVQADTRINIKAEDEQPRKKVKVEENSSPFSAETLEGVKVEENTCSNSTEMPEDMKVEENTFSSHAGTLEDVKVGTCDSHDSGTASAHL